MEVDTPILRYYEDPTDTPVFSTLGNRGWPRLHLRTCPEEFTRRPACVYDKVFEIGKCFRNEKNAIENDHRMHLPEFTMAEFYEVGVDLDASLQRLEDILRELICRLDRGKTLSYDGHQLDFDKSFERIKVMDAISDIDEPDVKAFVDRHKDASPEFLSGEDRVLGAILDTYIKPRLIHPTFLTHFPKSADQLPDQHQDNEILRAELVVAQMELGEIGLLQQDGDKLMDHCDNAIADRYCSAATESLVDRDYVAELSNFNVVVGGGAVGIDRLAMLVCNTRDIREVVWYPMVGKFFEGRDN